jgi:geranylgeranyl diphosphate synthase, type II
MEVGGVEQVHSDRVARLRAEVDASMRALRPVEGAAQLYEPVRYVLTASGKRFRPVLLLLAAEASGSSSERALPAALAVEVFHNFTLVHDDIMDHSHTRRGRPTVHVAWDADTAILCGDLLMAFSVELLSRVDTPRLAEMLRVFYGMVARLCEGQALDKAFERREDVSVDDYLGMIDCKTGALIEAALELGALTGNATEAQVERLRTVGRHIGRAFQIQDDLLDLIADDARWGKVVGQDLIEGKKTFLLLHAIERARPDDRARLEQVVRGSGVSEAEIAPLRTLMDELGVLDEARRRVGEHTTAALGGLSGLPPSPALGAMAWLVKRMSDRRH